MCVGGFFNVYENTVVHFSSKALIAYMSCTRAVQPTPNHITSDLTVYLQQLFNPDWKYVRCIKILLLEAEQCMCPSMCFNTGEQGFKS